MFVLYRFFEQNPEYQRLFPEFKDVPPEELEKTNALYGHAKRVMKAVENAVSALDDAESFSAYLEELGRRHKSRALKPTYLDVSCDVQNAVHRAVRGFLRHFERGAIMTLKQEFAMSNNVLKILATREHV